MVCNAGQFDSFASPIIRQAVKVMQVILKQLKSPATLERTLLENKQLDVCEKNKHGDAPIHFAARMYSVPIMSILKDHGADMEAVNEHGRRPLHEAIDSLDCVTYLVDSCGADVNALKRGDWTPVMIAALKGRLDIVQKLVSKGAMLGLATKDGRTALHMACEEGHVELSRYLALQYPKAIQKATNSGRIPPQIAAGLQKRPREAFDIASFLIANASLSAAELLSHRDKSGRVLLQDAILSNNLELVQFLFENGADPNDADSIGRTGIHSAAMIGHLAVLRLVLSLSKERTEKKLVQWDTPDSWDHWTPLMHAAREGHLEIVRFLVDEVGADTSTRSKQNQTASDLANMWQHHAVAEYLDGMGGSQVGFGQSKVVRG